jgi:2-isopropylmalate synthase
VNTEKLKPLSDFVSEHMLPRQPHSPIVGDNAARHSSGGHTNAILRDPMAYQPFDPKEVGTEISFIFGPLSGGNHAKSIIESRGFVCTDEEKTAVSQFIKDLYRDRRKGITDDELMRGYFEYRKVIIPSSIDYSKSVNRSTVLLTGKFFEQSGEISETHEGKDSALAALKRAIDKRVPGLHVESHRSTSKGAGIDAVSLSMIVLADDAGCTYEGMGEDQDIEISAMKALIEAVNAAHMDRTYRLPDKQRKGARA